MTDPEPQVAALIGTGNIFLGIEFGSTRIKACLTDEHGAVIATGGHDWENQLVGGLWSYDLAEVDTGLQSAYRSLVADCRDRYGITPVTFAGLGISAMMHGYLAFDADGRLLAPFRTWRNTNTDTAARELTAAFGTNIPHRWSVAHLYQAVLDHEPHVPQIAHLTTLAGYVHHRLTDRRVLGVGDASGMFPIDPRTGMYDAPALDRLETLLTERGVSVRAAELLPTVLPAGADAGSLTADGATLIDPTGGLQPGVPMCPPEGDAGTGMVATCSVAPLTANISAGTSIFAMVVLDRPLTGIRPEIDLVTTPAGDPVAMVHCNNGSSEVAAWADVFAEFAAAIGADIAPERVYSVLFDAAAAAPVDAGGVIAYNYLAGEPITDTAEGRPLVMRRPDARFDLGTFMRAQLYAVFGTLSLGMQVLADDGVAAREMFAHGGLFRTPGVAQSMLAAALDAPVTVAQTGSEGGAWGMALLAIYAARGAGRDLDDFLRAEIFEAIESVTVRPDPDDVVGYRQFLAAYTAGLATQRAATASI